MKVLIVDNYDSFTFNLYQLIAQVSGALPIVVKNNEITWEQLRAIEPDCCVISPGPGRPENESDFGICTRVIRELDIPILGVCLGHQGIGHVFGGRVISAPVPVHGRVSRVHHTGEDILSGIPQEFEAVRYHSLIVARPLPECLRELGWTAEGITMAMRHRERPVWGVQFHPESICTECGQRLIENFIQLTSRRRTSVFQVPALDGGAKPMAPRPTMDRAAGAIPCDLAKRGSLWRIYSRKLDFYPDPEHVFRSVYGDQPFAIWLDSSQVEIGLSRFSFMGAAMGEHSQVLRYRARSRELIVRKNSRETSVTMSVFEYVKTQLKEMAVCSPELPFDFNCGFVGYWGYEMKAECGGEDKHAGPTPDVTLLFLDRLVAFDHQDKSIYLVYMGRQEDQLLAERWFAVMTDTIRDLPSPAMSLDPAPVYCAPFRFKQNRDQYLRSIESSLRSIRAGESYEICLTNKLYSKSSVEPMDFYSHLRRVNPAPYAAYMKGANFAVACSSPERFLRISRDGEVESKPIKGTLARGADAREDDRRREFLQSDPKNRSENLMIVDLLRNDLGRVCEVGTVHVPKLMHVETFATVHHLVSTIRGRLREDLTVVDCLQSAFPGGSMTGAPKIRTMQLIDELEPEARGVYSGCLGFMAVNGTADLNIVIRTAIFRSGEVSIGVGGAIVALSDPETEFEETLIKAGPLLRTFRKFEEQRESTTSSGRPSVGHVDSPLDLQESEPQL